MYDSNFRVRGAAAWALGEIGDKSSVPILIHAFIKYDKDLKILLKEQQFLQHTDTRSKTDFYYAIEKLSGQKFGFDYDKLIKWCEESKDKFPVQK